MQSNKHLSLSNTRLNIYTEVGIYSLPLFFIRPVKEFCVSLVPRCKILIQRSQGSTPACNSSSRRFPLIIFNWSFIMTLNTKILKRERGPIILVLIFISIFYFREDIQLILHCKQIHDFNLDHHSNIRRLQ